VKNYWVYIITGRTRTLYIRITNDLERRVAEHKHGSVPGFCSKYTLNRLAYCEEHADVRVAIEREKKIKRWRREKKVALVESINPEWKDLSLNAILGSTAEANRQKSLRVDPSTARRNAASVGMTERRRVTGCIAS
jgi:putative endonuclease